MAFVKSTWYGDGAAAWSVRAALWPLSKAFALGVGAKSLLYETGILPSETPALPTVSVGNLTVGGTGKTPFASWLATQLSYAATPAIVLRGYRSDETRVHRILNPSVPVVVNPDRAAAIREAKARDADVVVLDDGFQHRRIARFADIVLLSAEQVLRPRRLLPTGPWREPLSAATRADLIVVTRKSGSRAQADQAVEVVHATAPGTPIAMIHLAPAAVVSVTDNRASAQPVALLRGASVLAIAGVGEPELFKQQLEQLGGRVTLAAFRDHHAFTPDEIAELAARVPPNGFAVCTLKDAVKLADRWPGPSRLWYVSQQLVVEQGAEEIDLLLKRVLEARAAASITAG
jgi:tetraacyldisaccharide 4'-kinase